MGSRDRAAARPLPEAPLPVKPAKRDGLFTQLWRIFARSAARFVRDDIPTSAAGTTFYLLLAFFPAVVAFVSLYGLFADIHTASEHLSYLRGFLPADVLRFVSDEMVRVTTTHPAKLSGAFLLGLLISLWSANAGVSSLMVGLNVAYEQKEARGLIATNLVSLGITIGALVACIAAFVLVVAIPVLQTSLGLPSFDLLGFFRWPLLFVGSVALLAALYRFGPNHRRHARRRVMLGALFAATVWLLVSLGFSWYVGTFAHYDKTYGSLGTMVGLLMWIWLGQMVILFGAELNSELEQLL
jgi:membrane protein